MIDDLKQPKNLIYLLIIAISLIVMIVLGVGFMKEDHTFFAKGNDAGNRPASQREEKIIITTSTETVEDGLNNMGILITQEYYFTQVETYTKEKKLLNFISTESGFSYSYDGKVTAGVDFEKISIKKDDDAKEIVVDIPESSIQSVDIDTDTFKIYSEKESLWNPIKLEDYNMSLVDFEDAARQKALENGILDRSDAQAKNLVTNFIRNFPAFSEYKIEFKMGDKQR
jgi:hypothetical protein